MLNPFSLEFLGALKHLSGVMDVYMLVSCHRHGGFVSTRLVNFNKFDEFLPYFYTAKFCAEESFKPKDSKISGTDQKSNTEIGVRSLYLSPILYWFYHIRYMVRFWCGNTSLKGDFKNAKTYQNMKGQEVVRPLSFYLEIFNQIDS